MESMERSDSWRRRRRRRPLALVSVCSSSRHLRGTSDEDTHSNRDAPPSAGTIRGRTRIRNAPSAAGLRFLLLAAVLVIFCATCCCCLGTASAFLQPRSSKLTWNSPARNIGAESPIAYTAGGRIQEEWRSVKRRTTACALQAVAEPSPNQSRTAKGRAKGSNAEGRTGRNNSSPKAGGPCFKKKKSYRRKKKFTRKLPPGPSEKAAQYARRERRKAYEALRTKSLEKTNEPPSIWSFDSLFAAPIFDETSIREDLYGNAERADEVRRRHDNQDLERSRVRESAEAANDGSGSPVERAGEPISGPFSGDRVKASSREEDLELTRRAIVQNFKSEESIRESNLASADHEIEKTTESSAVGSLAGKGQESKSTDENEEKDEDSEQPRLVDPALTRMVEDRIYGMTRGPAGATYSTSLLDSGRAVQFREGRRLGKALPINIDRLCHFAKKDFAKGRFEEAQEGYMQARNLDPSDGRPYLGLSRVAQRRGDLLLARKLLKEGISRCDGGYVVVRRPKEKVDKKNYQKIDEIDEAFDDSNIVGTISDSGPNPFLLQALGTLEQKLGNLGTAEELYLQAIRSRPSHAAAWVSLAQLRTKVLRQGASVGRACYQSAERELRRINAPPSSFVYTAWASMEYKKSSASASSKSVKRARDLYLKALEVDPKCSVAYLQLGVMESDIGNFDSARECFEKVLKFDQRNSRVLQAYALMESRREDADDRKVLDLFERALKANPKDGGVYQAYALFVVELGDIESARDLYVLFAHRYSFA